MDIEIFVPSGTATEKFVDNPWTLSNKRCPSDSSEGNLRA